MCTCKCAHDLRSCGTLQQALALVEQQRPAETQKDIDSISEATTLPFLESEIMDILFGMHEHGFETNDYPQCCIFENLNFTVYFSLKNGGMLIKQ